ncbi:2,3-butanediol dehydrogenase [Sporobolomyces koalae]|uniref:2,3-butanediol dehydrogenase n=1 Tax=Sporobolomyces koalae TaxID=500713 RepID=UPI0031769144
MSNSDRAVMKSALFYGKHDIKVEQIPRPTPQGRQVLVKVAWCGICGTDLHEFEAGPILCPTNETPHALTGTGLPVCLGHEFSGIVDAVGDECNDWKVGDRVCIEAVISCHECYACKIGCNNACSKLGFVGLSTSTNLGGGLSEYYLCDRPEDYLHRLPDSVSLKAGAMCEPLAVAIHAVKRSGFKKGEKVLVCGSGPIGSLLITVLKSKGASQIIVSEPSSARRAVAERAGADHLLDPMSIDVVAKVKELTGGPDCGVNVAFEAAGNGKALEAAIGATCTRGRVLNVSVWSKPAVIDMNKLVFEEKTILGSSCYRGDHEELLAALDSGSIKLEDFITATIPLDDLVEKGFKELIHNNENHVKILVSPSGNLDQPF